MCGAQSGTEDTKLTIDNLWKILASEETSALDTEPAPSMRDEKTRSRIAKIEPESCSRPMDVPVRNTLRKEMSANKLNRRPKYHDIFTTPYKRRRLAFENRGESNFSEPSRDKANSRKFNAAREDLGFCSKGDDLACNDEKFVFKTPVRDASALRDTSNLKNVTPKT